MPSPLGIPETLRPAPVGSRRAALLAMALITVSATVGSLAVALLGAVIAGAGAGVVQMGAMAAVLRLAPVDARAGVTSAFFTACYLAMSVPVVVAGLTADRFGLDVVTWWYLVALAVLATAAVAATRRPTGSTARATSRAELRLAPAE